MWPAYIFLHFHYISYRSRVYLYLCLCVGACICILYFIFMYCTLCTKYRANLSFFLLVLMLGSCQRYRVSSQFFFLSLISLLFSHLLSSDVVDEFEFNLHKKAWSLKWGKKIRPRQFLTCFFHSFFLFSPLFITSFTYWTHREMLLKSYFLLFCATLHVIFFSNIQNCKRREIFLGSPSPPIAIIEY